jgi:DNA-binding CsgD family transcriptional regulator
MKSVVNDRPRHFSVRDAPDARIERPTDVLVPLTSPNRVGPPAEVGADRRWASLTHGELRVVSLVAQGMSNRSIADELYLSRHTIDAHLKHIYLKLDIHSRVELTVLALQHRSSTG